MSVPTATTTCASQQHKTKSICKAMRERSDSRREASATIAEPKTTELATAVGPQLTTKIFPLPLIGRIIHTARQEQPHD
jgi:hypothetical protein